MKLKIDMHLHTNHSFDCESNVADVLRWAELKGLDAIALTDHDVTTAYLEARGIESPVRIIPGVEVTTRQGTHVLGYFITSPIVSSDLLEVIDEIHERGGICSLPHPYRSDTGLIYNHETQRLHSETEVAETLEKTDLIEALNAKCSASDRAKTEALIKSLTNLKFSAGSDGHHPHEAGRAFVELEDVRSLSDVDLKSALLYNHRKVHHRPGKDTHGMEGIVVSFIEGARHTFKSAKSIIPAPLWRRMRSSYMKSRGAALGRNEMRNLESLPINSSGKTETEYRKTDSRKTESPKIESQA